MDNTSYVAKLRKFIAPEFIFGNKARLFIDQYVRNFCGRKVFIVTDDGLINAGWSPSIIRITEQAGAAGVLFKDLTPNPKCEEVMHGAEIYVSEKCDIIIAVGGGSVIDCAKGIGIVAANGGHIKDYEGIDQIYTPIPPIICIPSTAGTSADVSQFAIITDVQEKRKFAIISKAVVPDISLIDPEVTYTMDKALTSHTGSDALVHAIEAYASKFSSPITDLHAIRAIEIIVKTLPRVVHNLSDPLLREQMMLASLHAGLAFSNASLGLVHAMAHVLGGTKDLPHGECNAILLRYVIEYNYDSAPLRYETIGKALGCESSHPSRKDVCEMILCFMQNLGIKPNFDAGIITPEEIPALAEKTLKDPCILTNPVMPSKEDIEALYGKAFAI
ncbi:MAG: iron-containing alcohol dehydrogenase [Candidatus Auribacterota bacterium]